MKLSLLSLFLPGLRASCSNNGSSVGKTECIRVARYSARQFATCVNDLYIRQKSKGKHGCTEDQESCVYQCMLEVHGLNSGDVYSPCGCSLTEKTTDNIPTQLPSWCFSPTGAECNWYRICLKRRYVCNEAFNANVVIFAEQFCKLYLNAYSHFTSLGDLWLNGVRKCLLVSLVPLLREWQQESRCGNSLTNAITTFSNCFISPFPGIPSICHIPLRDFWGIFWHLRQTLPASSRLGLKKMLKIIENCTRFHQENLSQGKVRKLVVQLTTKASHRELKSQQFGEEDQLAKTIGDKIATELLLDKKGITWFAYTSSNAQRTTQLVFFIADKHGYRIGQMSPHSDSLVNLNDTISKIVQVFCRNMLNLQSFGHEKQYLFRGIIVCHDFECGRNSRNMTADSFSCGSFSCALLPLHYSFTLALLFYGILADDW